MLAARIIGSEAREELGSIQGIGPAIAQELVDFFAEPHNLAALDDLAAEVTPEAVAGTAAADSALRRQDPGLHRHAGDHDPRRRPRRGPRRSAPR